MSQLSLFGDILDGKKPLTEEKPKNAKKSPRQKGFKPRDGVDKRNTRIFIEHKKEEKNSEMMSDSEYDEFTKDINAKFGITKKIEHENFNSDLVDDLPF